MDLNKIPRWALVVIAFLGLSAMGTMISTARADLEKFRGIAYQAKNVSEANTTSIVELKESVSQIKAGQEVFRKEYREDRNKDADLLRSMEDRIIRAVNK